MIRAASWFFFFFFISTCMCFAQDGFSLDLLECSCTWMYVKIDLQAFHWTYKGIGQQRSTQECSFNLILLGFFAFIVSLSLLSWLVDENFDFKLMWSSSVTVLSMRSYRIFVSRWWIFCLCCYMFDILTFRFRDCSVLLSFENAVVLFALDVS